MQTMTTQQVTEFLTGTSLSFHWWTASRSFEADAIEQTATMFSAERRMVRASNKILDGVTVEDLRQQQGLRQAVRADMDNLVGKFERLQVAVSADNQHQQNQLEEAVA